MARTSAPSPSSTVVRSWTLTAGSGSKRFVMQFIAGCISSLASDSSSTCRAEDSADRCGSIPPVRSSRHIRELPLESPAGEPELLAAVERLLRQRLDPSRPLWEMWFLPGLPERRVGLFVDSPHHRRRDGGDDDDRRVADPAPDMPRAAAPRGNRRPGRRRACSTPTTSRAVYARWPARCGAPAERGYARCALRGRPSESSSPKPATATSLDRMVGPTGGSRSPKPPRRGQGGRSRPRRDGERRPSGGHCRRPAYAAGKPRRAGGRCDGAHLRPGVAAAATAGSAAGQPDRADGRAAPPSRGRSVRRLRQIAAETTGGRHGSARSRNADGRRWVGRRLLLMAVMRQRVNVTSASIPGPKMPLYLAGAGCSRSSRSCPSSPTSRWASGPCHTPAR